MERMNTAVTVLLFTTSVVGKQQPNILFILADDYGFNDIGYHGSEIKTPELDKLAAAGVKLENYYVQPLCSPTRTQLMTGRYQIHTGTQHSLFWPLRPNGMSLKDPTLADKLKQAGYSTHAVGKWHLGFFRTEYLPTNRGFDTFFGILSGKTDHYLYNNTAMGLDGLDLYDGTRRVNNIYRGRYSTELYTEKSIEVIKRHDKSKPLFLYLSFQAVHMPLQVPERYVKPYRNIDDKNRRVYAGMTSAMDEAVGKVVNVFRAEELWDNTLLVFSTDNGGQILKGANNWPLRGWKGSLWEGGIRGIGFVHGHMVENKGRVCRELIHVSDWFPTLINLAGGTLKGTKHLDGQDQWRTISTGAKSARKTILHNIDPLMPKIGEHKRGVLFETRHRSALRHGDWKILTGDPGNGSWILSPSPESKEIRIELYERLPNKNVWLFNVTNDPKEKIDLSDKRPEIVKALLNMLAEFSMSAVPCYFPDNDFNGDPKLNGGYWGPWVNEKYGTVIGEFPNRTWQYSFLTVFALVSYCVYYRYVNYKRLSHTNKPKLKN